MKILGRTKLYFYTIVPGGHLSGQASRSHYNLQYPDQSKSDNGFWQLQCLSRSFRIIIAHYYETAEKHEHCENHSLFVSSKPSTGAGSPNTIPKEDFRLLP